MENCVKMTTLEGTMEQGVLDDIIRRLLQGKGAGKQVQLMEGEIRQLCVNARNIFLSQPNLLQIRAPIRICGLSSPPLSTAKHAPTDTYMHAYFLFFNIVLCLGTIVST